MSQSKTVQEVDYNENLSFNYGVLEDFFSGIIREGYPSSPSDIAYELRAINTTLTKALAELHNHNIKLEVSNGTMRGIESTSMLAELLDLMSNMKEQDELKLETWFK